MKRILYLGTDPTTFQSSQENIEVVHYPIIHIAPRSVHTEELQAAYRDLPLYTHIIFTSKNAVDVFFGHMNALHVPVESLRSTTILSIGSVTTARLQTSGITHVITMQEETQEGVMSHLEHTTANLENAYLFLPRSSRSRPALTHFLTESGIRHRVCDIYDTYAQKKEPVPDPTTFDEIVFTSPSTVEAFLELYSCLPMPHQIRAIGPITSQSLEQQLQQPELPQNLS